ncbi:biotin--[acetyl-CoA-carboxylase] ligase [Frigoribacterium salinisoli]
MGLDRSRAVLPRLAVLGSTGSTNADLLAVAADEPHLSVLATLDQTAGRGRLGRRWVAPPGRTLAASVLLDVRPTGARPLPAHALGWVPLLAGVALAEAVAPLVPGADVGLKWPNDVLLEGDKACGLLAEVAAGGAVVVGAGVDLVLTRDELPTPTSTSLALHGATGTAEELADRVLAAWVPRLDALLTGLSSADGDARAAGVHALATHRCASIGRAVEVHLPDGRRVLGTASALADDGRLVVAVPDGPDLVVGSGDVVHLRHGATP